MDLGQLLLLLVTILLVALLFYISGAMVGQEWSISGSYALRVLIVSVIAVVVIPLFKDAASGFDLGDLGLLFAFVLLVIAVRFIMIEELTVSDEWLAAIVVSLIGVVLIYMVDAVARHLVHVRLLSLF